MTRFRVTISFEYEVELTEEAYGTTDPVEAAKVDQQAFDEDPFLFLGCDLEDLNWQSKVEVVE